MEGTVVRQLLDACGPVSSWKPVSDADTGNFKGFGFCNYETAEGALVALRVLNDLEVDGQKLQLKCNKVRLPAVCERMADTGWGCLCHPFICSQCWNRVRMVRELR